MSLRKIFDTATQIEGFEVEECISDKFGFLENFGDGAVCIHPNFSSRKELIALLAGLPNELLKHDVKRDEDRLNTFTSRQVPHQTILSTSEKDAEIQS